MIFTSEDNLKIKEKWKNLCKIHSLTKKYTILSEEYSIDMKTYIQPIKEQKDAYEHIVRAYERLYGDSDIEDTDSTIYILKNLDKAISHEFRAFYDTMDYISIILREIFYNELKYFSYNEIIEVYPEYTKIKARLMELPSEIAEQRKNKDIGINKPVTMAIDYCTTIDELFEIYKNLLDNVLKKIEPI